MENRKYSISVAMATYNGEKFIKEQLDSILCQLNNEDEVVISDDGSTDTTREIIKSYEDTRIKLVDGPKNGLKQNFANAISKCKGKYIFLSDQDDIWEKNKVEEVLKVFDEEQCTCVVHDCTVFNSDDNTIIYDSFFEFRNSKKGVLKNIIKNSYIGCCMAFSKDMIKFILPIPNDVEMHDQWIGIKSEINGKSKFIDKKLIRYRRHTENVSKLNHYGIIKMIKNRINLVIELRSRINEK